MLIYILLLLIVIAVAVIIGVALTNQNDTEAKPFSLNKKLFQNCTSNFDCDNGHHCELRDHPSQGICVIAPGGACHRAPGNDAEKSLACYSGYYCDKKEGICLRK